MLNFYTFTCFLFTIALVQGNVLKENFKLKCIDDNGEINYECEQNLIVANANIELQSE